MPLLRSTHEGSHTYKRVLGCHSKLVFFCSLFGLICWYQGSIEAAKAYLAGEIIYVADRANWVGEVPAERELSVPIRLQNLSDAPIEVLGARSSCYCVMVTDLPLVLNRRETKILNIQVDLESDRPGELFSRTVQLTVLGPTRKQTKHIEITIEGMVAAVGVGRSPSLLP